MILATIETGWHWRDPEWFWLLLAIVLLFVLRSRRTYGVRFAAAGFSAAQPGSPPLPRSLRQRFVRLPLLLEVTALVLGTAALARPVQRVPLPPEREGRDVLLCLDRSSSMAAFDLAPARTRLEVGIEAALEFVAARPQDRIGFVDFARFADLRCPPTLDHAAVRELLARVGMVAKDGPEDATGIGNAVAVAAAVLQRSPAKGKVVVLLTDGEENVATSGTPDEIAPLHAAQLCAQLGIRVHTIVAGLGNQRADGRFLPLDTTAVRQLAATTRGRFFTARDAAGLQAIWAEIDALEAVPFAEPRTLLREGFALLVAAAVVLLFSAHVLSHTRLEVLE